jgi:hypothetical protein
MVFPGNANLLIGDSPRANQEIGVPARPGFTGAPTSNVIEKVSAASVETKK